MVNTSDYGPGIRLYPIHAHDGALLREADVLVTDAPDPDTPKRTIRRARRTDHLLALLREGTIDQRQADAGELLRNAMERTQCSLPAMSRSEVHIAPWDRTAISEQQLRARRQVCSALAAIDVTLKPVVLWILATELLRRGLGSLADHYRLAVPTAA